MLVALLIMGIVLAALAPAFYGSLKAAATSNDRSIADGLAVAANEQIRSLPYYEVGYLTTPATSPYDDCAGGSLTPVTLSAAGPMDSMSTAQPVGGVTYHIRRCVYWQDQVVVENAETTTTVAGPYKKSVVTVMWTDQTGPQSVTETSAVYPGGRGLYTTQDDNYSPPTTAASSGLAPGQPGTPTVAAGTCQASCAMTVSWPVSPGSPTPDGYLVDYNTTGDFSGYPGGLFGQSPLQTHVSGGRGSWTVAGLAPDTLYWFQVIAVYQGTDSVPSLAGSGATAGIQPSACVVYSLVVNPTQAAVDVYGYLQNGGYFTMTVNASQDCTTGLGQEGVWVYYTTSSSTPVSTKLTPEQPQQTMLDGAVPAPGGPEVAWTPGNHTFTVYTGSNSNPPAPYNPRTEVQVNICQPDPVTGQC